MGFICKCSFLESVYLTKLQGFRQKENRPRKPGRFIKVKVKSLPIMIYCFSKDMTYG